MTRSILVLVFAAFLATSPAAQALPVHDEAPASGMLQRVWSLVANFWSKNGCRIDPDGYCVTGLGEGGSTTENGCVIEPNGQCAAAPVNVKNGCQIDPSGRCLP
jgi:hypothetical protein